ncbi:hypothetical protein [cf. Phormidesmis sp. LEGE 11477]|uniref:hypothetical protein n=1 Tax=cf. Phormidesmis sp. LEGE 11477 TaxID=1828680 RepID=UPI00187F4C1E|nr:hypothetical protein [cf. Phormidesmis sp. LEGE 11477]MBE9061033.1 hypothetical protein [cf. Phormidesmis sp. LEGE 11477]
MTHASSSSGDTDKPKLSAIEAELLQTVLDPVQSSPWINTETAAEYEERLLAAGAFLEISEAEAAQGWETLSTQLDGVWINSEDGLLVQLQQKFAERVPADMLAVIAEKAQQMANSGKPMMKQMIGCVQECLNDVAEADLRVIARPMALAMRGSSADEFVEATVQSVRQTKWNDLSAIEQAKLGLAAARYAIAQVNTLK